MTESWLRFKLSPKAHANALARGDIKKVAQGQRHGPLPGHGTPGKGRPRCPMVAEGVRLVREEGLTPTQASKKTGASAEAIATRIRLDYAGEKVVSNTDFTRTHGSDTSSISA